MRRMIFMALLALAFLPAVGADTTPEQYATGSQWEGALAGSPEVNLLGATSMVSWNGNIYLLQGNTVRKLSTDLKEIASVQLPDMAQVLTSLEHSRAAISCGMHGPDPSGRMTAGMNQFNANMQNNWQTTASLQQASDQDMVQGLHQAHTVTSLGAAQIAADQYGVYVLRGGRLTVFDHNLREVRSQEVLTSTANAADCPTCVNALSSGAMMDQVRFRGMQSGLCPGPGKYDGTVYMGDTSRERMANRAAERTACPGCALAPMTQLPATTSQVTQPDVEIPASLDTTPSTPEYQPAAPQGGVTIGPGLETFRPGRYAWMYEVAGLASGQVVPVATRNVINGSVLLGLTGTAAGPQFLHVHVLQPTGIADPGATITAYLYDRGYVDDGRNLNLIRHGGGEYMIRFDPTQMHGDTLAVRVMRPGMRDEVIFFSLAGSELAPQ